METYVLLVATGEEHLALGYLDKRLEEEVGRSFMPKVEIAFRRNGITRMEQRALFPGYIMVESALDDIAFREAFRHHLRQSSKLFSMLHHGQKSHMRLPPNERDFLNRICNPEKIVEESIGMMEGDRVHIISGPLVGMDSQIVAVHRHARKATIAVEFMGGVKHIKVGLEIILPKNSNEV